MFDEALKYPVKFEKTSDYIIGSLLWFASMIFVLPYVLVCGYLIEVIRTTINGSEKPPSFSDISIKDMAINGLKYTAIYICYLLPLGIIAGLLVYYSVPETIVFVFIWLSMVIIGYIIIASTLVFAKTNSIVDSFNPKLLTPILLSKDYVIVSIVLFSIGFAIGFLYVIISLIPIIGWLIMILLFLAMPLLSFLYSLFTFRYYGLTYKKILDEQ